jgi:predicted PurR-regulated permease PerM
MLSQFIRGQLIVMVILAVLYSSAYALLGVRLAVPIGMAAGGNLATTSVPSVRN